MKHKILLALGCILIVSGAWATDYTLTLYADGCSSPNVYTCPAGQQLSVAANVSIEGNRFLRWSDGNTENPRLVTMNSNKTLTAYYGSSHTLTIYADGCETPNIYTCPSGQQLSVSAIASIEGNIFARWQDGNTDNPRLVTLDDDMTLTAFFVNHFTVSATSSNDAYGKVSGSGTYRTDSAAVLLATPNYGYYFTRWSDGNTENPRTILLTKDTTLVAEFAINQYVVSVTAENGSVTGAGTYDYLTEVTLTVTPDFGYEFIAWSDGNTENPRILSLTQDTMFVATFGYAHSGICGANLTWQYANGTLYIHGTGDMYNFTSTTMPWLLLRDSIQSLAIDNGVTSIGNYAFYGCQNRAFRTLTLPQSIITIGSYAFANCNRLTSINFSNDLEEVGDYAFSGCTRVNDMTIYATITPDAYDHTFDGVNTMAYLYVLPNSVRTYKLDLYWGVFDIQTIGAETSTTPESDNVVVEPGNNEAVFTWPMSDGASTYSLSITKDSEVFCVLTFNANGQLTGIAFAPSRTNVQYAPAAELTATGGMTFTVTGLNSATAYTFTFDAKDSSQNVIASYQGNFATTGYVEQNPDTPTSVDHLQSDGVQIQKVLRDGVLYILTPNGTFNATGRRVEE